METKETKQDQLVIIETMINKLKITDRNAVTLFNKYRGVQKKEQDWLKLLKEKKYIA